MRRRFLADFIGDGTKRQFAQGRQVRLPEEIRECLLDLLRLVDLSLPQASPKFFNGNINVDDLVCPIVNAWDLHLAWPEAAFTIVPDAGHSWQEPATRRHLLEATESFKAITAGR